MEQIRSYLDLEVWKKTKDLAKEIYLLTNSFPSHEQFGLVAQLRRASVSVPSNIAEGCGRDSSKDTVRFLFIARGGLYEIETQILLAHELGFIKQAERERKDSGNDKHVQKIIEWVYKLLSQVRQNNSA